MSSRKFPARLVRRAAAPAIAAAALAAALPAGAQDAKPEPTSCAGLTFTDPAGDQALQRPSTLGPGAGPAPQNLDLLRGFFRYAPANGQNVMTANLEVTKLDKTLPIGSTASAWYMRWNLGDLIQYVSLTVGEDGKLVYDYGHLEGTSIVVDGTTTGRFLEGQNGMVEIVVPVDKMKISGKKLTNVFGQGRYVTADRLVGQADRGPDTGGGKDFTVTPCAEAGTATPVQPGPDGGSPPGNPQPPQSEPQPQQQPPAGQPGSQPAPGSGSAPATGPASLNLKVVAGKLVAKKIKKRKRLTVGLQAGERITGLKVQLLRGRKVVGTGKLAAVGPGKGKITVKLAKKAVKKFRKGTFTLRVSGKKADGRTASGSVALRIK